MNIKQKVKISGRWITVLVCLFFVFMFLQRTRSRSVELQLIRTSDCVLQEQSEGVTNALENNVKLVQTIDHQKQNFKGISVKFSKIEGSSGTIHVNVVEDSSGTYVTEWTIPIESVENNEYTNFVMEEEDLGHDLSKIRVEVFADVKKGVVKMWKSSQDSYQDGELYYESEDGVQLEEQGDLTFKTVRAENNSFLGTIYGIVTVVLLLFTAVAGYFLVIHGKVKLEQAFLCIILVLGLLYMLMLPPFSAPDEPMHFATSYKYARELLGEESLNHEGNIIMRDSDAEFFQQLDITPSLNDYDNLYHHLFEMDSSQGTQAVSEKVVPVNVFYYIPQILGVFVGLLLHLGYMPVVLMGRLFNLLTFAILAYWGIKKMPFGKMVLFAVAMLPMTLELISSYSYDAIIIGLSFFFIGSVMNLIYKAEKVRKRDAAALMICMLFLAPLKMVYMFLGLLCFLIPKKKFANNKYFWGLGCGVMFVAVFSILLGNLSNLLNVVQPSSAGIIEWAGKPGYTLGYLLKNPATLIRIYMDTFIEQTEFYFLSMMGGMLAWLELHVPTTLIVGFSCLLLLSAIPVQGELHTIPWWHRFFYVVIFVMAYGMVLLSMLTGWTTSDMHTIAGVQGRYFLPLLPLLLLLIRCKNIEFKKNINHYLAYAVCLMNVFSIIYVFRITIAR